MSPAEGRLSSSPPQGGTGPAFEPRQGGQASRLQEFEEVALAHLDRVYQFAFRLCRKRPEAEDLVQETYLRAFRSFHQFQPGTNCRAWLLAILHNAFVNGVKREWRQVLEPDEEELERLGGEPLEGMATFPNPEEECFKQVVTKDLVEALDRLPVPFREAVLLADLEECSYKEIAQICGVPTGTVMSRLFRGRRRLQKALTAGGRADGNGSGHGELRASPFMTEGSAKTGGAPVR